MYKTLQFMPLQRAGCLVCSCILTFVGQTDIPRPVKRNSLWTKDKQLFHSSAKMGIWNERNSGRQQLDSSLKVGRQRLIITFAILFSAVYISTVRWFGTFIPISPHNFSLSILKSLNKGQRVSFPRVNWPGSGVNHPPPSRLKRD